MTVAVDNEARALGRVGQMLKDKYRLDAVLGVGGMATVFAATHRNAKRVAIKMLLPELAGDQEVRGRFVREGYAANTIEHPGALSVLDDDVSEDGLPYLVMELLEGETVEARWEKSGYRLEADVVLAIAAALLDVLAVAHAKGIVHRDIKPENLFLLRSGGLKVLDFGIARVMEATLAKKTSTRAGMVMGTPAFMAPEQALAKWEDVDGRTDLWAVGATMFTLLSGHHVHEGSTGNEQLVKSATQPAASLAEIAPGLPRSVVAVVDRALAFDRTARWPDATAMAEAVRGAYEAVTGAPLVTEAPPTSAAMSPLRSSSGDAGPVSQRRTTSGVTPAPRTAGSPMAAPTAVSGRTPAVRTTSGQTRAPTTASVARSSEATLLVSPDHVGGPVSVIDRSAARAQVEAYVASKSAEKDQAAQDLARLEPVVAEVQARLVGARKTIASLQEQIAAARKARTENEERFRRQKNARLEGIGEARKAYRSAMGEVARTALGDPKNFPADVGPEERAEIDRTQAAADARDREAALHEAALASYDPRALRRGVVVAVAVVVLLLLSVFSPLVLRSCDNTGELAPPAGRR